MRIFLDTTDPVHLQRFQSMGLISGVTMNQKLVAQSGRCPRDVLLALARVAAPTVESISVPLFASDPEAKLKEAADMAAACPRYCAKLMFSEESLKLLQILRQRGIRSNVTLVFGPPQALLAHVAGPDYVSIFVNQLDGLGHDGFSAIVALRAHHRAPSHTRILAASLRNAGHVLRAFEAGADIVTLAPAVLESLLKHPLTDATEKEFLAAADAVH